jgi:type VI secretion system secreted protein Hcp
MAVDMFLKLDGIEGEAKDKTHKNEIHIESFSFGESQTGTFGAGGGGGAGKVTVQDVSVTKFTDKATAPLMLHCATGKHIKEGLITVRKAGEHPLEYLKIKLTDILVSSVQLAGHNATDILSENVSLNFAQIRVEYQEQSATGGPEGGPKLFGWDLKANAKL